MNRHLVAGAFYGEQLPSGEWMAIVPNDAFYTHQGRVPLPPGQASLAQPRCTNVGGFRFGGQVGDGIEPAAWQFDGGAWHSYPQPCVGVNATIYDRTGAFIRSDGSVGSQGFRYVTPENVIVSGDATYRKPIAYPAPADSIFEYTDLGDGLFIGQAAYDNGGVQVWDGSMLRQLELGVTTFVRANRDGETVGIAFTVAGQGVVRMLTTMAELRALPPVELPDQPPTTDPPPIDPPVDPPIPPVDPPPVDPPVIPPVHPPEGRQIMVYVDTMQTTLAAFPCEEIQNGDGTFSYRKPNGKYLSLNLFDGTWLEADTIGPWEQFKKAGTALVLDLDWDGTRYAFIRPLVEIG